MKIKSTQNLGGWVSFFVLMVLVFSGYSTAIAKTLTWKFAHSGTNGDMFDSYGKTFKEIAEKEFNGRVSVALFPAEQLGNETARFELIQNNAVEFCFVSVPVIGNVIPETLVFGLNFIFTDDPKTNVKILQNGKATEALEKMLEKQSYKVLDWLPEDFACWSSNKPIRKFEDIKNQKIRVMDSKLDIAGMKLLGANPTPIAWAELYSALQLNMVDGQQNSIDLIDKFKLYEVQKYIVVSNHFTIVNTVGTNPQFFAGLSPEDQKTLENVFKKVNGVIVDAQARQTKKARENIEKTGKTEFIELSTEERGKFINASRPLKDEFIKIAPRNGKQVYELFMEDIKTYGNQ